MQHRPVSLSTEASRQGQTRWTPIVFLKLMFPHSLEKQL